MRRWAILSGLGAALAWLVMTAGPTFGDSSGTVSASVTAQGAAACITVSPGNISFGTRPFSTSTTREIHPADTGMTVNNCGTTSQHVLAKGTNASVVGGGTWTLSQSFTCPTTNQYGLNVGANSPPSSPNISLTTNDQQLVSSLGAGASTSVASSIVMPCSGSAAGQANMSIIFTAVLP